MNKVTFKVIYTPGGLAREMSDFMANADLGIDSVAIEAEWEIETKTKITKKYIKGAEKVLWKAIEESGGVPHSVKYSHHIIN